MVCVEPRLQVTDAFQLVFICKSSRLVRLQLFYQILRPAHRFIKSPIPGPFTEKRVFLAYLTVSYPQLDVFIFCFHIGYFEQRVRQFLGW